MRSVTVPGSRIHADNILTVDNGCGVDIPPNSCVEVVSSSGGYMAVRRPTGDDLENLYVTDTYMPSGEKGQAWHCGDMLVAYSGTVAPGVRVGSTSGAFTAKVSSSGTMVVRAVVDAVNKLAVVFFFRRKSTGAEDILLLYGPSTLFSFIYAGPGDPVMHFMVDNYAITGETYRHGVGWKLTTPFGASSPCSFLAIGPNSLVALSMDGMTAATEIILEVTCSLIMQDFSLPITGAEYDALTRLSFIGIPTPQLLTPDAVVGTASMSYRTLNSPLVTTGTFVTGGTIYGVGWRPTSWGVYPGWPTGSLSGVIIESGSDTGSLYVLG